MNAASTKTKSNYGGLLKIFVSASLLFLVYKSVNFKTLLNNLSEISIISILYLCLLYLTGQIISIFKWRIFLKAAGINKDLMSIVRAYFFGMFINAFGGIGTVGGDLARSIALKPEKGFRAASLASVAADRIHGLATLLLLGSISIAIFRPENLGQNFIWLCSLGSVGLLILWLLGPKVLLWLIPKNNKFHLTIESACQAFPSSWDTLLAAGLISLCLHTIQIFMVFLIAKELHADIPLSYLFSTVPIVNAASSLPISTNGLGIRETMFNTFFSPLGISIEKSVAFGALWLIVVSIVSSVGGVILAPGLIFKKRHEIEKV